jgi:hypothetical protein
MAYYGLDGLRVKRRAGKVVVFEVGLDCSKIRHESVIILVPFLVFRHSIFSFTTLLMTLCSCSRLVASVITIESGLPVLPGVASSCGLSSVLEDSVSMLAALSTAKIFRVSTALGWC